MIFNKHYDLEGRHAFLGASTYHWINDDPDKLAERYLRYQAKQRGTELHEFAATAIRLNQKLQRTNKTLNRYVNDAIGYRMTPEVVLYYSNNCFGTADAISFKKNMLRIHDLKTGTTPAHMEQLMIYAALFCLEYRPNMEDLRVELRIYQNDEVMIHNPSIEEIYEFMDIIVKGDKVINKVRSEEA